MKKLLFLLSLLTLLVLLPACIATSGCEEEPECSTTQDCIEKKGEDYICIHPENSYQINSCCAPMAICVIDRCKSDNIDCGLGVCENHYNSYSCNCNEDAVKRKSDINGKLAIDKCIENSCNENSDCNDIFKIVKSEIYGYDRVDFSVCSSNKCVAECETDFDCDDKFACYYGRCESILTDTCHGGGGYSDRYNNLECRDHCGYCMDGMSCDSFNNCVPECKNDEDCKKDKFTTDICNTKKGYCEPFCYNNSDCLEGSNFCYDGVCLD
jgi:hypothetical protein